MAWLIIIFSYLFGSMPTSYLMGHIIAHRDIRGMGDKNAGANNAFRQLGAWIGIAVGVIDAAKGAAVILIAQAAGMSDYIVLAAGLAAVVGHNWPVYLRFRGGRGVATTVGVLAAVTTIPVLVVAVPTLLVILLVKHSSIFSMTFLYFALLFTDLWFKIPTHYIIYSVVLALITGVTSMLRTGPKSFLRLYIKED